METALRILRGMADQGNTYLSSRHSLLLELRGSIGKKDLQDSGSSDLGEADQTVAQEAKKPEILEDVNNTEALGDDLQQSSDLPALADISFRFDIDDDPALWEGALNQIDIDMDADWIESNLYR